MFNFWDSCTEPPTEPLDSWAQNDPQKMIKIEFVTSLVKSKLKIGVLRGGLRDMIISKYKPSPFTGIKNHFNIYIRSFSILIWSQGSLKHQLFEAKSKIRALKNRDVLAHFQKIVRALQFRVCQPILMLLTWFFLHCKSWIYPFYIIWKRARNAEPPKGGSALRGLM